MSIKQKTELVLRSLREVQLLGVNYFRVRLLKYLTFK